MLGRQTSPTINDLPSKTLCNWGPKGLQIKRIGAMINKINWENFEIIAFASYISCKGRSRPPVESYNAEPLTDIPQAGYAPQEHSTVHPVLFFPSRSLPRPEIFLITD